MTTRAQLEALVELVRKATPPDRAIEADVVELCFSQGESELHRHYGLDVYRFTSSLDAVVGLIERELPGWTIARVSQNDSKRWTAELREGHLTSYNRVVIEPREDYAAVNPALALLAASLSAKLMGESE